MINKQKWIDIFTDLNNANEVKPRGLKSKEILNYSIETDLNEYFVCSFDERKFNLKYIAGEFAWYLRGDRNDESIIHYSKFWDKIKNKKEPLFNSNYGYYILKEGQFDYVIKTLTEDKYSRQAVIMINNKDVIMSESNDKICTYSLSFNIRDDKLNMHVNMRSNDIIRGFSIDVLLFSFIYEMLYVKLNNFYPNLERGIYYHNADSFHIYEIHYKMLNNILDNNGKNYYKIDIPRMSNNDVDYLLSDYVNDEELIRNNLINKNDILSKLQSDMKFSKFLINCL